MATARPSVTKRQREQKKQERKAEKAARRVERKNAAAQRMPGDEFEIQHDTDADADS